MADETPAPQPAPAGGDPPPPKAERKATKKKPSPRAVAVKKPAAAGKKKPARKPRRGARSAKSAGGRRPADVTSKADLIRKVAGIIKAKGQKPRPVDIVRILGEEGVAVSAAQVSQTLKAAGYRPVRKRRQGGMASAAPAKRSGGGKTAGPRPISVEDLLAAKSVSGAFGGTDQAIAVLQALKRIER
jgi:hypothetical protein